MVMNSFLFYYYSPMYLWEDIGNDILRRQRGLFERTVELR